MRISSGLALRALAPMALLLAQTAAAPAQSVEQPPSFNAAQLPGIKRVGENYTIRTPVKSDGILRIYVLATPYGDIHGAGRRDGAHAHQRAACAGAAGESEQFGILRQGAGRRRA